jgi:hypothetical protein
MLTVEARLDEGFCKFLQYTQGVRAEFSKAAEIILHDQL